MCHDLRTTKLPVGRLRRSRGRWPRGGDARSVGADPSPDRPRLLGV